jgi:hypothetical protein
VEKTRPALRVDVRRPQRADARRNFDALLAAARDAFATKGVEASLEDIAKQAGVGIGTLYRRICSTPFTSVRSRSCASRPTMSPSCRRGRR